MDCPPPSLPGGASLIPAEGAGEAPPLVRSRGPGQLQCCTPMCFHHLKLAIPASISSVSSASPKQADPP